nr:hypothetical protein Iba_chr15aCG13400 [Ipomoea batatas]
MGNYSSHNDLHKLEKDQRQLDGPRKYIDILKETMPKDQLQFEASMNVVDDKSVHDLKELSMDKNLHIFDKAPPLISPPSPRNIPLTVEEPMSVMKNYTSLSSNEDGIVLEKIYVPLVSSSEEINLMANTIYIQENTLQAPPLSLVLGMSDLCKPFLLVLLPHAELWLFLWSSLRFPVSLPNAQTISAA